MQLWFTDSDVVAYADALGVTRGMSSGDKTTVFSGSAAAAQTEWERITGWSPFTVQASGAPEVTTRRFDPGGFKGRHPQGTGRIIGEVRYLNLQGGIVSTDDLVVRRNVTPDYAGDLMVLDEDFRMVRYNAEVEDPTYPYTMIEWNHPILGVPKSVSVTGYWGFCHLSDIPADVLRAVKGYAVRGPLLHLTSKYAGTAPVEWAEGDVRERYDGATILRLTGSGEGSLHHEFMRVARLYMRVI